MGRPLANPISPAVQRVLEAVGATTVSEGARLLGFEPETVRVWSKNNRVPEDKLRLIALQTGYRFEWLADGAGQKRDLAARESVADGLAALSPRERALIENFRSLTEPAKRHLEESSELLQRGNDAEPAQPIGKRRPP